MSKMLRKWNYNIHEYEPYNVPDEWDCPLYADLFQTINCCKCGKKIMFGWSYSSKEVHNFIGLAYSVCEECHIEEVIREKRSMQNE